ncbi:MAG: two pore domain potassium channel family protein [Bryobacterales bacterium]|nr:two pore domain potassium channel family protein [Bryobacterales bacterium]
MFCWGVTLTLLAAPLLFFSIRKLIAIVNAIVWMRNHGLQYTEETKKFEARHPGEAISEPDLDQIYDSAHADFWPHGLKDYRLRRRTRGRFAKDIRRKLAFTYPYLILEMFAFVVAGTSLTVRFDLRSCFVTGLLATVCVVMGLINIAMVVEFLLGNIIMEKYVRYFHVLDDQKFFANWRGRISDKNLDFLRGVYMILALLGGVVLFGFAAVYFGILLLGSFVVGGCKALDVLSCLADRQIERWFMWTANLVVMTFYYVTTTLSTVGYGDIYANDLWGYLVASSLHVQQIALFAFAASIFLSARS